MRGRGDALIADFRGGVTCLIGTQVACTNACAEAVARSVTAGRTLGASRARQPHRSTSQPRHGLRRLGQARLFQQRVVGPFAQVNDDPFRRDLDVTRPHKLDICINTREGPPGAVRSRSPGTVTGK